MSAVAAVVLMGGRAERLGGLDKAALDFSGKTTLDLVLAALAGASPTLLATGSTPHDRLGYRGVADLPGDYGGPLAGLAAAVQALTGSEATFLVSVAVDTPFFPRDFLASAIGLSAGIDVVMAAYAGQDYPTNALWRLSAIADLPAAVLAKTAPRSLKKLADGCRSVIRLDYADRLDFDPFLNANTPQDLENLRRIARLATPG